MLQQELERLGKEKGLAIAVGYMLRYNPAIETAQALLKEVLPRHPAPAHSPVAMSDWHQSWCLLYHS